MWNAIKKRKFANTKTHLYHLPYAILYAVYWFEYTKQMNKYKMRRRTYNKRYLQNSGDNSIVRWMPLLPTEPDKNSLGTKINNGLASIYNFFYDHYFVIWLYLNTHFHKAVMILVFYLAISSVSIIINSLVVLHLCVSLSTRLIMSISLFAFYIYIFYSNIIQMYHLCNLILNNLI